MVLGRSWCSICFSLFIFLYSNSNNGRIQYIISRKSKISAWKLEMHKMMSQSPDMTCNDEWVYGLVMSLTVFFTFRKLFKNSHEFNKSSCIKNQYCSLFPTRMLCVKTNNKTKLSRLILTGFRRKIKQNLSCLVLNMAIKC